MNEFCKDCKHWAKKQFDQRWEGDRFISGGSACGFSGEKPIMPNPSEPCVFLESEGKSRFESKPPNIFGKLIEFPQKTEPYPESAFLKPKLPGKLYAESRGEHEDGTPYKYLVDKRGNYYSVCKERKFLGKKEDVFPEPLSSKEMSAEIDRVHKKLKGDLENG